MRPNLPALVLAYALGIEAATACDLALALAVDVSGSVDDAEFRTQMDGLAAALRDPVISEALVRGQAHLLLVQWTGASRQRVTIPWTRIGSFDAIDGFADRTAAAPRDWRNYSTAIGEALRFTVNQFGEVTHCRHRLIDLSGDGVSNEGVEPSSLRPLLEESGIVVNAVAIEQSEPDLTAYYFEHVIAGDGAFVATATGFADYPQSTRRKLLREVARQSAMLRQPP